jgi:hypothetical protein
MHKILNILAIVFISVTFLAMPAIAQKPDIQAGKPEFAGKPEQAGKPDFAGKPDYAGKNGQAGKSNIAHLYFYEKTGDPDWEIVEDGAWGKMKYNLAGPEFDFVFNGHGLEAGSTYTLIYYPDPWPGDGLICLGSGLANQDGDVHIMGSVNTGDLPKEDDANYSDGAKIWLVLTGDVQCPSEAVSGSMTGWNPTEYLFESDLVTFDDLNE